MDCNSCEKKNNPSPVPYIVYESSLSRAERNFRRMFWAFIAVLIALFITNAAWIYCWQQYDYSSTSTDIVQDGQGLNIVGDRNMVDEYEPES